MIRIDRLREQFTLEEAVHMITAVPARAWGFAGRGLLRVGMRADVNVFDFARLNPRAPQLVSDLPTGARRLIQKADGYLATIVNGEVLLRNREHTGATPGLLLRGSLATREQAA